MHSKYGVDTEQSLTTKVASEGCGKPQCPRKLDESVNPPKCEVCGFEYLQEDPSASRR